MKRIIVLSFKDGDVYEGLRRLIALNTDAIIVLPVVPFPLFLETAIKAISESNAKYHLFFTDGSEDIDALILKAHDITMCTNPLREVMREITANDILAMVWDNSMEAHLALHAVEDLAIETWNIDNGLDFIVVDSGDEEGSDMLYEEMQTKLSDFIESFSEYIMHGVLEVLSKAVEDRIREDEGKKDIDPFGK